MNSKLMITVLVVGLLLISANLQAVETDQKNLDGGSATSADCVSTGACVTGTEVLYSGSDASSEDSGSNQEEVSNQATGGSLQQ